MLRYSRLVLPTLVGLLPLAACSSSSTTGATSIPAGGATTIQLVGASDLTLRNDAAAALPVTFRTGTARTGLSVMDPARDSLAPGISRWWSFDESITCTIENPTTSPALVSFVIKGADIDMSTGGNATRK